jgi:hypothetical protein
MTLVNECNLRLQAYFNSNAHYNQQFTSILLTNRLSGKLQFKNKTKLKLNTTRSTIFIITATNKKGDFKDNKISMK